MEIKRISKNGIIIKGKKETIFIDPPKDEKISGRLVIKTINEPVRLISETVVVAGPGEYEVGGVAVSGINLGEGKTMYTVLIDGVMVGVLGEPVGEISDKKQEKITSLDVMIGSVKIGGKELDKLAKNWGANILIPVGYDVGDENIKKFLDETDNEGLAEIESYKIEKEELPEGSEVVCLMQ